MPEFHAEDCRLDGVESAVHAANLVNVARLTAVVCDEADFLCEFIVACEKRSAVPVATERLCRVKARDGNIPECAGVLSALRCPERLGGIFDKPKSVFFSDFLDFAVGGALAKQVDRNDPARFFSD